MKNQFGKWRCQMHAYKLFDVAGWLKWEKGLRSMWLKQTDMFKSDATKHVPISADILLVLIWDLQLDRYFKRSRSLFCICDFWLDGDFTRYRLLCLIWDLQLARYFKRYRLNFLMIFRLYFFKRQLIMLAIDFCFNAWEIV